MVYADNKIHLIAYNDSWKNTNVMHLIWNEDTNSTTKIHDLQLNQHISDVSAVYIASKQTILLMFQQPHNGYVSLWKYCLKSNKWTKINLIRLSVFGSTVLTSNEQYVIIAGGQGKYLKHSDKIYVLDITDENDYKLRESGIRCQFNHFHRT